MGSSNETSYFGPVRNPWDGATVPGGLVGRLGGRGRRAPVCAATGTDTGGSIRQPAALTGITGLKPTYGRCSRWGMIAFASSLDQAGPMTRSAEDAAIMLGAMAGFDPRDSTSADRPVDDYVGALDDDIRGPAHRHRQGVHGRRSGCRCRRLGTRPPSTRWQGARRRSWSRSACRMPVCRCRPTTWSRRPSARPISHASTVCVTAIAAKDPKDLEDLYKRSRSEGFGAEVKRRIMIGHLCAVGRLLRRLLPEGAEGPPTDRRRLPQGVRGVRRDRQPDRPGDRHSSSATRPTTPCRCTCRTSTPSPSISPACRGMSIPAPQAMGMPVGLQLIGNYFDEARLLNVAHQLQLARTGTGRRQRASSDGLGRREGSERSFLAPRTWRPTDVLGTHTMQWETVKGSRRHLGVKLRARRAAGAEPGRRCSGRCASAAPSAPRSHRARSSRARTTSTRTCPRATRSASTSCRWWARARSRSCSTTAA
jgi:aspartyl-tRNA(Asn)/glutamyl-tRNA(Gln) amidotransferase subunit A